MNLKELSRTDLEKDTLKWVRTERKVIHIVLAHLLELSARKIYSHYEYDGMYTYMTRKLGYSGPAASLRLKALDLLKAAPQIADKIKNRTICLSQMAQVQNAIIQAKESGKRISNEITLQVLEQIENKTTFETKSILAKEFDLPLIVNENIKPQKDNSVRIEITLSQSQFAELEQAKVLLSHICPGGQWADVIATLASKFNKQKLVGRKFNENKKAKVDLKPNMEVIIGVGLTPSVSASEITRDGQKSRPRRYISVQVKRLLHQRSKGCCEFKDVKTGHRCSSKFQLQVDHIKAWALGGGNEIGNLRLLCRKHNIQMAEQMGLFKGSA